MVNAPAGKISQHDPKWFDKKVPPDAFPPPQEPGASTKT